MARTSASRHSDRSRWIVLGISVGAQSGTSFYQFGIPYLLPQIRSAHSVSLFEGALLIAAPTAGMIVTLLLWGLAADRVGDRPVMATGLLGACASLLVVWFAGSTWELGLALLVAGGFGASVNVTSGRLVLRSFAAQARGLAMGIRQTSPLIGMGLAALVLPALGAAHGYATALLAPAAICLAAALAALALIEAPPARGSGAETRTPSPYRRPELWLLHSSSALLVLPQIAVATFAFIFLVDVAGWTSTMAGVGLAAAMFTGGLLRLLAGVWSDRVADRTRPIRTIAVVSFTVVTVMAVLMLLGLSYAAPAVLVAAATTSAWNGLAFTAVAEAAGPAWAGRALGLQNTLQYITTAAAPPAMALAIGPGRYGLAFLSSGMAALMAAVLVPVMHRDPGQRVPGAERISLPAADHPARSAHDTARPLDSEATGRD